MQLTVGEAETTAVIIACSTPENYYQELQWERTVHQWNNKDSLQAQALEEFCHEFTPCSHGEFMTASQCYARYQKQTKKNATTHQNKKSNRKSRR
jgi:hypothetical protein